MAICANRSKDKNIQGLPLAFKGTSLTVSLTLFSVGPGFLCPRSQLPPTMDTRVCGIGSQLRCGGACHRQGVKVIFVQEWIDPSGEVPKREEFVWYDGPASGFR